MTDLTQWARSLFNEISNPASAGNISTAARKDVPGSLPVIENHPQSSDTGDGYLHKDSERPLDAEEGSLQSQAAGAPAGTQAPPVDTSPAPDFRYRPVTTSVRRRG